MAASYTLATGRSNSGGVTGQLRPSLLRASTRGARGTVKGGQINPRSGNIGFTPYQVPTPVENMVSKGAQYFLGVTADAAFKYEQRESDYFANAAVLRFSEQARKGYGGYYDEQGNFVAGYASSKGILAKPAFEQYKAGLDEVFNSTLENLEPRVRQKALLQMQSVKNQYLSKAATHRVTQMTIAQEQQRFMQRTEISAVIAADPSLLKVDPRTGRLPTDQFGINIKQRYVSTFNDPTKAAPAWWGMVSVVNKKIYLEAVNKPIKETAPLKIEAERYNNIRQGLKVALDFANTVGTREMAGSPDAQMKLQAEIKRWNQEAVRTANQYTQRISTIKKNELQQTYDRTDGLLTVDILNPNNPRFTREQVTAGVLAGTIRNTTAKAWYDVIIKGVDSLASSERLNSAEEQMTTAAVSGGLRKVYNEVIRDPEIIRDVNGRRRIDAFYKALKNPEMGALLDATMKQVESWITGPRYLASVGAASREDAILLARKSMINFKLGGMSDSKIMEEMKKLYYTPSVLYRDLPALPVTGTRMPIEQGKLAITRAYTRDWAEATRRWKLPENDPDNINDATYRAYSEIYSSYRDVMRTMLEEPVK